MIEGNNNINNTSWVPKLEQLPVILKNCALDLSSLIGEQIDKVLKLMEHEKQNPSEVFGFQITGMQSDTQEIYNFFANIWGSDEKGQSVQDPVKQIEVLVKQLEVLDQEIDNEWDSKHKLLEQQQLLRQNTLSRLTNVKDSDGISVASQLEALVEILDEEIEGLELEIENLEQKQQQKEKLENELVKLKNPSVEPFKNGRFNLGKIENLIKNNNTFALDTKMKKAEERIGKIEGSLKNTELKIKDIENDLDLINKEIEKLKNKKSSNENDANRIKNEIEEMELVKAEIEKKHLELRKGYLTKQIKLKEAHGEYARAYADQIIEFVSKAEIIQKEFDQSIDISEMQQVRDGAVKLYANISEEAKKLKNELNSLDTKTWGEFFKELGEIFEDSEKLNGFNAELAKLLMKIDEGKDAINEDELRVFEHLLDNSSLLNGKLGEKFAQFAQKHQSIMKILATVPTVGLGFIMGGPLGAFAAKMLSDKYLKDLLPQTESSSYLEKFGVGALETALSLVAGPYAALSTAIAKTMQGTASEGVQNMVTAGVVGLSSGGGAKGIGLGFLAGLFSAKPQILTAMAQDVKHVWKNIKEIRILTIFKDTLLFVPKQLFDNCVGIKRALTKTDGKRDIVQAITRIATIALAAAIIAASFWAIPLTIAIFYLVNKAYQPRKYQGLAIFSNQSFRKYVANEINGINGKKRTLEEILQEEKMTAYNDYIQNAKKINYRKNK